MINIILFKQFLAFYLVSGSGQSCWSYRPVEDVSASSPYGANDLLVYPQHVQGQKGK
ncbi:MAG: hypothetical protein GY874_00145 [Desulfobacteraceae bacterium]|nr:hypothetical protein [Desulfobacteraceae bacterium]